ncbi:pyrroloquinoline quinone biosynthesis protein PqqB [Amycolatopsis echigonensis]|uniref:Coenzyme PQQ synthesis protein B n=1 Tax=Amycolatopsis echigonensis TaxID=2576905 RepID=A0A8E1VT20_9PSEU|nr:pyrroloquinoline quinone biosynthesis protein PqqB [Amycolatopsis echigonensis]MBB2497542.1 pyrroloquinoline quinone biosynthesis protein PqqB [Amycolatopsis echigonensis]
MKVILLGTAAGGGFPQWNCACPTCTSDSPPRTQDSVAFSADGHSWHLLNASPDIRAQILATPALRAGPGPRETPLRTVLLTDAELDHTLGLLMLREAAALTVHAPAAALRALTDHFPARPVISEYHDWTWLPSTETTIDGLRITSLPVSDKQPKYARSSTHPGPWVVAYRIHDPATGGTLVYAPCLRTWPPGFDAFANGANVVLLDGTFYRGSEFTTATDNADLTVQQSMGHLPITTTLPMLTNRPGTTRWAYTHLNNTNPAVDPAGPEHAAVVGAGAELPPDGTEFTL